MPWITGNQAHVRADQVNAVWVVDNHVMTLVRDHVIHLGDGDSPAEAKAIADLLVKQIEQDEEPPTGIQTKIVAGTDRDLTPKERGALALCADTGRADEQIMANLLSCAVSQLAEHPVIKTLTKYGYLVHVVDGPKGFYWITAAGKDALA